jgi:catechol 2,3-dioxygenase-like lactoylglutathione lyase family enzyme
MLRVVAICLILSCVSIAWAQERPPISEQVTFLYYDNLDEAQAFYSDVLGLELAFDLDWVKIFRLSPTSSVGLVNASGGAHRPSDAKPVMVSMVVAPEDVDPWHAYLKAKGVDVGEGPKNGADGHVRAFGFKDPAGYTLEVFAWLKVAE